MINIVEQFCREKNIAFGCGRGFKPFFALNERAIFVETPTRPVVGRTVSELHFKEVTDEEKRELWRRLQKGGALIAGGQAWTVHSFIDKPYGESGGGGYAPPPVPPVPPQPTHLTLTGVQGGGTISCLSTMATAPNFEFSTDGGETWQTWGKSGNAGSWAFTSYRIEEGETFSIRGTNSALSDFNTGKYTTFSGNGKIALSGNIQSLVTPDADSLTAIQMAKLFYNNKTIVSAPMIPATTLTDWCYYGLFSGCENLAQLPAGFTLPATSLRRGCYYQMFMDCAALTQLPAGFTLPAATLNDFCYSRMFASTGLTSLPASFSLPATTLIASCYGEMFEYCDFTQSNDGVNFNYPVGVTYPQDIDGVVYRKPRDVARWMGNTTGFAEAQPGFTPYPVSYNMYGNNYAVLTNQNDVAVRGGDTGVMAFSAIYKPNVSNVAIKVDGRSVDWSELKVASNNSGFRSQIKGSGAQYDALMEFLEERDGWKVVMSNFHSEANDVARIALEFTQESTTYSYVQDVLNLHSEADMLYVGEKLYNKVMAEVEMLPETAQLTFKWQLYNGTADARAFAPLYSLNGVSFRPMDSDGDTRKITILRPNREKMRIYMTGGGVNRLGWSANTNWRFDIVANNSGGTRLAHKATIDFNLRYLLVTMSASMDSAAAGVSITDSCFAAMFNGSKGLADVRLVMPHRKNYMPQTNMLMNAEFITAFNGQTITPKLRWTLADTANIDTTSVAMDVWGNSTYYGTKPEITLCCPTYNASSARYCTDKNGNITYSRLHLASNCTLSTTPKSPYDKNGDCS